MELHYLFYVLIIGCAGSITAFIKNGGGGIKILLKRTWDGCFSAYVVYEIAFFFCQGRTRELCDLWCGCLDGK